jgi:F0F1-type ATP synthase assembly protein I
VDLRAYREVNNGFGDGLAAAFEIVATPLILAFFGYLLDRWLGLHLVFALIFGLFTFGYMMYKLVRRYSADMDRHDESAPWSRRVVPAASQPDPSVTDV